MKQVDFYLLANPVSQGRFKLAGRLLIKLQSLGKKSLIVTDTETELAQLDRTLWSFNDTSFVAHDRLPATNTTHSNTHLATSTGITSTMLDDNYDVLINLSRSVPLFSHHFDRIAELVGANDESKQAGRQRYKQYKTEGYKIETHPIEL